MLRLVRDEALAYLRLGLSSGQSGRIAQSGPGPAALFVPGVGANGAHFFALKSALQDVGFERFEAFEYLSLRHPRRVAAELRDRLDALLDETDVLLVGHSLGGVLSCMAVQATAAPPAGLAGLVTLGSPLHGTWRSKLVPVPGLRELRPDSPLMTWLGDTRARLAPLWSRTLTVGAEHDQMLQPSSSAFMEEARCLELGGVAHTGLMFDPRALAAVSELAKEILAAERPPRLEAGGPTETPGSIRRRRF